MTKRMSFAYLVSTSYSGSTLLAMLMNAHPQVASIGELDNSIGWSFRRGQIDRYPCSCGVEIRQCPFWKEVQGCCQDQGVEVDLHDFGTRLDAGLGSNVNRVLYGAAGNLLGLQALLNDVLWLVPAHRRRIERTVNRSSVIAQAVLDVTGKRVFFDASKSVGRAFLLTRRAKLDLKLVHLVRDPRGVLNSSVRHKGQGISKRATLSWLRTNQAALRLRSYLPDNGYLLVHYERLCAHPAERLAEICTFLGVESLDLVSAAGQAIHHLIGNRMRSRPFEGLRLDDAWREDLPPEQAAACMRITADVGRGFGYE